MQENGFRSFSFLYSKIKILNIVNMVRSPIQTILLESFTFAERHFKVYGGAYKTFRAYTQGPYIS